MSSNAKDDRVKITQAEYSISGYVMATWTVPATPATIAGWALGVGGIGIPLTNFDLQDGKTLQCGFPYTVKKNVTHTLQITPYDTNGILISALASDPTEIRIVA
ncbi:hypothetical protein K6W16_00935 [Burkholderia dolosa]|jgi:hypothetical protein|uniref:Uncharacterized protein n=1 Tax=Burkholderia dolosa TaxID=152500 RepID=A0A892ICF8_9BURK|nr:MULTISPECIES: hypothetical protein [Burkholderia]AKE06325.1 hypothetical protein XM57_27740 [Burkholderia cepacia]AJY10832.1 hypothetical protein AK34_3540 [Burkholderia dolosa AU0158]AYZ94983.1 hypothetical protein EGY28_08015 [Burkholderia dolosa]ETP63788.1 hypothetical protein BDSB_21965 [Burkholderia dolosa PC543]MBR8058965.1 hypothetical protein [Burkholderia dolosa]